MVYDLAFIGDEIHEEAIQIMTNFKRLFSLYAECDKVMNSRKKLAPEDIDSLGMFMI